MNNFINCKVCGKKLTGRQMMFCSSKCKNKVHQSYGAQKERSLERKLAFVKKLGGKCSRCGYQENLAALSFHHKSGKEYKLDSRSMSNRGLSVIENEIAKCELLCSNCHMALHHPSLDLAKMSIEPTALTTELQALVRTSSQVSPLLYNTDSSPYRGSSSSPKNLSVLGDPSIAIDSKEIITNYKDIEKKFRENLTHNDISDGAKIVLGVSGGIDSIVMLNLFSEISSESEIIVAHMNHNLREDADADELFVQGMAQKYGYKFISKKLSDIHSHIHKNTRISNLEETLRDKRREFLLAVVKDEEADFLALAHNADDQAETFIMNAMRGSGPAGLGAMSMSDGNIIRPLLNISRAEIAGYAIQNNLDWHEDTTNQDITYTRNYIRHQILPLLTTINPNFLNSISRTTYIQRKTGEYIKSEASRYIKRISDEKLDSSRQLRTTMGIERIKKLPKTILYEIFGLLYEKVKGNRKNLSLKHLEDIENLVKETNGSKSLDLPGEIVVHRSYDKLDFTNKISDNVTPVLEPKKLKIGMNHWDDWRFTVTKNPGQTVTRGNNEISVDSISNIKVRVICPGDRIKKKGLSGRKKLQDLFVDAKIDRGKRMVWPIFEDIDSNEIIWVPKLAISEQISKEKNKYIIKINEEKDEASKEK